MLQSSSLALPRNALTLTHSPQSASFNTSILTARRLHHFTITYLLQLVVLALRELYLIPHNLYTLFCIHGQICTVNTWYIPLIHLRRNSNERELKLPHESSTLILHMIIFCALTCWSLVCPFENSPLFFSALRIHCPRSDTTITLPLLASSAIAHRVTLPRSQTHLHFLLLPLGKQLRSWKSQEETLMSGQELRMRILPLDLSHCWVLSGTPPPTCWNEHSGLHWWGWGWREQAVRVKIDL